MIYFYVGLAILIGLAGAILIRRQLAPNKINRYQKQFQTAFEGTQDIQTTDIVPDSLIKKLNNSLDYEYMEKVNTEYRLRFRTPQGKMNEIWREWKRYAIMTAVFGKVEMFNHQVDELWHIMLEDKHRYQKFCNTFIGEPIQHHPYSKPLFKPVERTLFDFLYIQLFKVDRFSLQVWGNFFKHDKGTAFLEDFEQETMDALKRKYMRKSASPEAEKAFEHFVVHMKEGRKTYSNPLRYRETGEVYPAYFTYAYSEDYQDRHPYFGEPVSPSSPHSHAGDHSGTNSNSSHDSHDSSSSCSPCSSCSS